MSDGDDHEADASDRVEEAKGWAELHKPAWEEKFGANVIFRGATLDSVYEEACKIAQETHMRIVKVLDRRRNSLTILCARSGRKRIRIRPTKTACKRQRTSIKCNCPFKIRLKSAQDEKMITVVTVVESNLSHSAR